MTNKLKKYKIEDCRPSFLGHWIFYMVAALHDIKEFQKKKN